jgi:hypothetical protein
MTCIAEQRCEILRAFVNFCLNKRGLEDIISLEFLAHLKPYITKAFYIEFLDRLARKIGVSEAIYQLDNCQEQTDIWLLSRHGIHIRSIFRDPITFNAKHLEGSGHGNTFSENLQKETRKQELAGLLEETTDDQTRMDILEALTDKCLALYSSFQQEQFIQDFGDIVFNTLKRTIRNNTFKVGYHVYDLFLENSVTNQTLLYLEQDLGAQSSISSG